MTPTNILDIRTRTEFREWLANNHLTAQECWVEAKRGKSASDNSLWYLDAVEEALCFGWIDSTIKTIDGVTLQRFGPRSKNGRWTELNKERCRRLVKLGLMTEHGRAVCPPLDSEFVIIPEILDAFTANRKAWENFRSFPPLYRRVRIDNIQRNKAYPELFHSRLQKLIQASECGKMIGDWNDNGRLLDY